MTLRINSSAPDFTADSTMGPIRFHDFIGDGWCILFSHPKDFTPVCTTELGQMAGFLNDFADRNCKIIGLSADTIEDHDAWTSDIEIVTGNLLNYPVISDTDLRVAKLYGMLPEDEVAGPGRTAVQNATIRSVFIIDPAKTVRLHMSYPFTCGRNFGEVLRALDSLQLTDTRKVGTPSNWTQGDEVLIMTSVSDDEARDLFPQGWRAPRPYTRFVQLQD